MVSVTLKKVDGTTVTKQIEKPRYGGTFTWAITSGPNGWDEMLPGATPYGVQINWMGHTNEELLEGRWEAGPAGTNEIGWNSTGYWANPNVYRGNLAESWEFPDNTTIIYHIRKGVRWALNPASEASRLVNGREFTAEDAAYNIKRIFTTKTSTMYSMAGDSRALDAYATDKYTVVVKNAPGQQGYAWEYAGDWMSIYPPEVIKKYGDHNKWENVVGTGPFMLTDFVPMSTGTWKRNPNYWMKDPLFPENQLPYIDTLKLLIIPDISTQLAAMRTGKMDRGSFNEEQAQTLQASSRGLLSISYLTPVYSYLGFRLDKGLPTDDINVRRALSMAINYKEIVDTYFKGHGEYLVYPVMPLQDIPDLWAAYTPPEKLPPAPDGFDNKKLYTYQPDEAKKLLAAAGYPNGFKIAAIISATNVVNIDILLIFKEYWMKNLNVDFSLDIKDAGVFQSMHTGKTYKEGDIIGRWGDQPYAMCEFRKDTVYNTAVINDPEMDAYYNQMNAVYFDVPKRTAIVREMNLNVLSKVYYFVPPVGYTYVFYWPWLGGYHGESATGVDNGIYQKYIWIDQELKKSMGY